MTGRKRVLAVAGLMLIPAAAVVAGAQHAVSQKDKRFSVAALAVKVGDKVVFKNEDDIIHNVYSPTKGFEFNMVAQKPGTAAEQGFNAEGTVEVRCAFHPTMKLTITVK
jgi:plastocyanin